MYGQSFRLIVGWYSIWNVDVSLDIHRTRSAAPRIAHLMRHVQFKTAVS